MFGMLPRTLIIAFIFHVCVYGKTLEVSSTSASKKVTTKAPEPAAKKGDKPATSSNGTNSNNTANIGGPPPPTVLDKRSSPPGVGGISTIKAMNKADEDSNTCAPTCFLPSDSDKSLKPFIQEWNLYYFTGKQLDSKQLKQICGDVSTKEKCMDDCPDGYHKSTLQAQVPLRKYVCSDKDFADQMTCFKDVMKEMEPVCYGIDKCELQKYILQDIWSSGDKTKSDFPKHYLETECEFLNCFFDCIKPKLSKKCGAAGQKTYNAYLKQVFDMYRQVLAVTYPKSMPKAGNCTQFE